jgi:hypothetical protein
MNEATFWSTRLKPLLHEPRRGRVGWKVPTELRKGLPDVWFSAIGYGAGWLELKYIDRWPKRVSPVLDVTAEQVAHLREAHDAGALTRLVVGIADDVLIIGPQVLRARARLDEVIIHARIRWPFTADDLLLCIQKPAPVS